MTDIGDGTEAEDWMQVNILLIFLIQFILLKNVYKYILNPNPTYKLTNMRYN